MRERGRMPRCIVASCTDTISSRYRFPVRNAKVKEIWLQRINNQDIIHFTDEELYNKVFLCGNHFLDVCKGQRKLLNNSLPTRYMPGFNEEATVENSFYKENLQKDDKGRNTATTIAASCDNKASTSAVPISDENEVQEPITVEKHERDTNVSQKATRKIKHLTKEQRDIYKFVTTYKNQCCRLRNRISSLQQRLKMAQNFASSQTFIRLKSSNPIVYNFVMSQLKLTTKKSKGRRFTVDDKILALSLYKSSPKTYRLLCKIFALPATRTLRRLLEKIPFFPGINQIIFEHLQKVSASISDKDRYCTIAFDEVALQPGLYYQKSKDYIEGFQCFGKQRSLKLADHALVFLAQSIFGNWKQPLAFMFCEHSTPSHQLAVMIKEIIHNLKSCNLIPIATICDQGATNRAALNFLLGETRQKYEGMFGFEVDGDEIIPLYDYPHLLKCVRNNLLTKDLLYQQNGVEKKASWDHLLQVYNWDEPTRYFHFFTKLTDFHVIPAKIKKMKVRYCTQVFSQSVGKFMQCLIDSGSSVLPEEARDTASLFLFLDQLFDSCNGVAQHADSGHVLRCRVTANSSHHAFWTEAKTILSSMRYQNKSSRKIVNPPSVANWIHTINGLEYIWRKLSALGFSHICPRKFNQDAVENFFSCIRSHGVRNVNPTCAGFIHSFKTLTINNLLSSKSLNSNCETDMSERLLNNFREFLNQKEVSPEPIADINLQINTIVAPAHEYIQNYICGYVAKSIFNQVGKCNLCIGNLTTTEAIEQHRLITVRRYNHKSLLLPSTTFMLIFQESSILIIHEMLKVCLNNNIKDKIVRNVIHKLNFNSIMCPDHPDLPFIFLNILTTLLIFAWTKSVNKILNGQDSRFQPSPVQDPVKNAAFRKRHSKKGN